MSWTYLGIKFKFFNTKKSQKTIYIYTYTHLCIYTYTYIIWMCVYIKYRLPHSTMSQVVNWVHKLSLNTPSHLFLIIICEIDIISILQVRKWGLAKLRTFRRPPALSAKTSIWTRLYQSRGILMEGLGEEAGGVHREWTTKMHRVKKLLANTLNAKDDHVTLGLEISAPPRQTLLWK